MRRSARIAGVLLLLVCAFGVGVAVTSRAHDQAPASLGSGPRDAPPRPIDEVRHELVTRYYRSVPAEVLGRKTIDQIVRGLDDPYTDYLTPPEYAALRRRTDESYSGLGLTVGPAKGALVVKDALRGPARAAGIQPGDRIVSIDGHHVRRLPFDRSLELMRGEEGTSVRLTIRRPREGRLSVVMKRREIQLPAVRARLLPSKAGPLGYVRVITFRANAAESVASRLEALLDADAKGIVLDLRDNPGGLLSEAVETVSLFVESGVVCVIESADGRLRDYEVSGAARFADVPLVVLLDRASASAAEVVAAALADNARARLVGLPTYGKASVQSVRELSNGAALKLTTSVFLTPTGEDLTGRGLAPRVRAVDVRRTTRDEALAGAKNVLLKQLRG